MGLTVTAIEPPQAKHSCVDEESCGGWRREGQVGANAHATHAPRYHCLGPGAAMIFKQFYLNCLAHASYFVGDRGSKTAAVIDPQRDIAQYLAYADEQGVRIRHAILTHFHADFVAGHLELRDRTGAAVY